MDQQGFAPASAAKTLNRAAHAPVHAPHAPAKPGNAAAQGGVIGARALNQQQTGYDAAIAKAETVRNVANLPFMVMMPGMAGLAVGKVAGWMKRDRTSVILAGTGDALMNGVRKTPMNKPLHLAADFVETIAENAQKQGGRAAPWAQSLTARSAALREGADKLSASIGKTTAPVMNAAGKGLETVGLKTPVAKLGARLGRYPLFAGIATVAAGAGIASIWLTRNKQSAEGKAALAELSAQFGSNHPLTLASQKIYSKNQTQTMIASGLSSIGEAMFVPFEALPHMGMGAAMPIMGAQMALPSLGQLIVSENPLLNAWANLQAEARGEMKLATAQKEFFFRQLLAEMPQVRAANQGKSGLYDKGVGAAAHQLAQENTSLAQLTEILKDPAKFEALSTRVVQAQQTAKPAVDPAAPTTPPTLVAGPAATIQAHSAQRHGVVEGPARAAHTQPSSVTAQESHQQRVAHARATAPESHR